MHEPQFIGIIPASKLFTKTIDITSMQQTFASFCLINFIYLSKNTGAPYWNLETISKNNAII